MGPRRNARGRRRPAIGARTCRLPRVSTRCAGDHSTRPPPAPTARPGSRATIRVEARTRFEDELDVSAPGAEVRVIAPDLEGHRQVVRVEDVVVVDQDDDRSARRGKPGQPGRRETEAPLLDDGKCSDLNSEKKASSGKRVDPLLTRMVSNCRAGRLWALSARRTWRRRPGSGSWAGMTAETARSMNAVMDLVRVPAPPRDKRPLKPPPRKDRRTPRYGESQDDEARSGAELRVKLGPPSQRMRVPPSSPCHR